MPQKNQYATANNNDYGHVRRSDITFGGIDSQSDSYMDRVARGEHLGNKTTQSDGELPGQHVDNDGAYWAESVEFQFLNKNTKETSNYVPLILDLMEEFDISDSMAMSLLDSYIEVKKKL